MAIQLDLSKMEKNPNFAATFMWLGKQGTRFYEAENGGASIASGYISNKSYALSNGGYGTTASSFDLLKIPTGGGDNISVGAGLTNDFQDESISIDASGSFRAWKIDLSDKTGGANLDDKKKKAIVLASSKNDTLRGNKYSTLDGGGGNDYIVAGSDGVVFGGGGNDTLVANKDDGKHAVLSGVSGNNLFVAEDQAEVTITDFNYGRDLIALASNTVGFTLGAESFAAYTDNNVTAFGYGKTTIESAKDYLQYTVLDKTNNKTNVVSAKTASTFIDLSAATDKFQIFGGSLADNEGNNSLHGGLKDDTIHAGNGDFVYGGGGNDLISLENPATVDATAERVALTEAGGKDTVKGFSAGWDDTDDIVWFYDKAADVSDVSSTGPDLVLTQGKGSLTLKGQGGKTKLRVQDENGTYKLGYAGASNLLTDTNAEANIYLGTAKKNDTISFMGADGDIVADLGNTGKYAGSARYTSIEAVVGGSGNNTLVGAAGVDNTIKAGLGSASIYGGGKSNDLLVSTEAGLDSGKTATFFFGAGDGKDTINGFRVTDEADSGNLRDTVNFYSGDVVSIAKNNTALTINMKDRSSLTLRNSFTGLYDKLIGVNVGGKASFAKVTGADEIVHYNSAAKYYVSGNNKGTVENTADGSKIYLDGRTGDSYKGFTNIKATAGDGLELAGDAGKNVVEYAGTGSASLYGGAGDDTLKGSKESGAVNTFFFGKKDGNDVITQSAANDKAMLYDVTLDDIKTAKVDNDILKVSLKTGGSLTVQNFSTGASVNEFALADGTSWSYAGGTWTQKTTTEE